MHWTNRWLGIIFLGSGCVAEVDMPFDHDGDGLLFEQDWGTDSFNPDSDGDGFLDGAEVDEGSDPLDPDDYPYVGGWSLDACRKSIESTGDELGDIVNNFELPDQHGQMLKLHDFCGRAVLLEVSGFT
jgi:hypothetical protein